jgi:HSP20 family protein
MYISPYRRLAHMRNVMDRMFDETMSENQPSEREMLLAVDVRADDDIYEIVALVPGLDAEDLNIEIINNTVSIRGEFKVSEIESAKYLISELPVGRFARTITLPVAVDSAKAEAKMHNGVLNLRIPKAEAHRPKSIKINAE